MTLLTGVRAVAARSASAVASSTGRSVVQPPLPAVARAARCLATTAAGGKPVNLALMGAPGVGQWQGARAGLFASLLEPALPLFLNSDCELALFLSF
jgi:hypothetical protein